ncbi:hypothetical protein O181_087503 [Austropuccinia psidii MF-1]|uniref:Integrase catalytic domain-containing protein n=1 Tax=Austropuccinia psidii MF-1 TaxID=1389203 RepID=A0A9Q3P187_9BASI|nr:hypothetical protein [Austropuccinia psidii MF-1]
MVQIQEPNSPWEIVHMDWVTELPPGGDRSYNSFLGLVYRYSKTPMFLPCHKDDKAMDTALMIWNKVISHTGIFQNIISVWKQNNILNSLPPPNQWSSRKNDTDIRRHDQKILCLWPRIQGFCFFYPLLVNINTSS